MNGKLGVSELEHVLVLSDDIDDACGFYQRTLGLRVGDRPALQFTGYWLYAGATPCLHIADRTSYRAHAETLGLEVGRRTDGSGPVDHIAFRGTDYDAFSAQLERAGVEPVRNDVPGGGPRQIFFSDPEGLRVEINFSPEVET
jgi:catechol 2,3-dioxygenase-like lactoylglutathione lyase family enzyme